MLLLLSTALAGPDYDRLLGQVESALAHAHTAAHADEPLPGACLTPTMHELRLAWPELTPDQRAHLTDLLAPGRADLFALGTRRPKAAPPPASGPDDSCWGQDRQNRLPGRYFVVEWDDNAADQETAQEFLDALEYAYGVEVEELGWNAPDGASRYLMPAFIERGNYQGAYTTVAGCGGQYLPYIVAYAGSFSGGDWYETMALHEFNHSIQFSYSYAPEFWWWEATATYIEEQVLPNGNWWSTYVAGYSMNPQLAMSAYSQSDQDVFYHMYGMAIWGFYLEEYQGGTDIVRQTWEAAADERGQYDFSMEEMTAEIGIDFLAAYTDFTARNAAMEYREHRYFMDVDEVDSVRELPASGASESRSEPGGFGQNYIRIDGGAGDGASTLQVTFHGDPDVDWLAQLVEVSSSSVERTSVGAISAGEGVIELSAFGDNDVYLVVSPLKNTSREYGYTWEAALVEGSPDDTGTGGDDTGTGGDDTGSGDGSGDDGEGSVKIELSSCGCASGGSPAVGVLGVLAGLVALRRRR